MANKVYKDATSALDTLMFDGMTVAASGFGLCGTPDGVDVTLQSENGMLGVGYSPYEGEEDADLINAGKQTIPELDRTSYFSSSTSFSMIRGDHVDLSILSAFDVVDGSLTLVETAPGVAEDQIHASTEAKLLETTL